jgi:hypothetical protein
MPAVAEGLRFSSATSCVFENPRTITFAMGW